MPISDSISETQLPDALDRRRAYIHELRARSVAAFLRMESAVAAQCTHQVNLEPPGQHARAVLEGRGRK